MITIQEINGDGWWINRRLFSRQVGGAVRVERVKKESLSDRISFIKCEREDKWYLRHSGPPWDWVLKGCSV